MDKYWVPGLVGGYEHSFLNVLPGLLLGESGKPTEPDFPSALQAEKVCEAVLKSAATGMWMDTGANG